MSKRLQVLIDDAEMRAYQDAALSEGVTVAEWVRKHLRSEINARSTADPAVKLAAIRDAAQHSFPTGDIDQMLAEIDAGRDLRG